MSSEFLNITLEHTYDLYTDKTYNSIEKVVCLRCGRPLTNEKSRLARLGPKCARKLAYETRTGSFSRKTLNSLLQPPSHTSFSYLQPLSIQQISLYGARGSGKKPFRGVPKMSNFFCPKCPSLPREESLPEDGMSVKYY